MKKTTLIAAIMAAGIILGFTGLIVKDNVSATGHDAWLVASIIGFAAFVGGFAWLWSIQPSSKR